MRAWDAGIWNTGAPGHRPHPRHLDATGILLEMVTAGS